uniref:Gamma-aminobutyric acid type B receptor subunit 1-like n=1 Tax=Saccoglossus kowalevskii TaxID=10224 RepID=A0ABM0LWP8_SACKO|nr:PREDICTED: gamma-aminobutyric acid type B receptor subunit 1-like [Saccoglossus kowalevskii]
MSMFILRISTLLVLFEIYAAEASKVNLTIGALFPMGGGVWDGSGILPGVELALQHINDNPSILPNYTLRMEWKDTQCDAGVGMKSFFELLYEKPTKIVLLGAACSIVSQPVAATAQHWNLVQLSYASASDTLSNTDRFKYFFRIFPTDSGLNAPRIELLLQYGWRRVATIHQTEDLFARGTDLLISGLEDKGIKLLTSESVEPGSVPTNQLSNIKKKDGRIILVSMYEDQARLLFCEAYKQGLYGQKYVYLLPGWYTDGWWIVSDHNIDCTVDQMKEAIEGYISVESLLLSRDDDVTVSGLTPLEYLDAYNTLTNGSDLSAEAFASYGYDATWVLALMFHKVAIQLERSGSSVRIEDFDYDNTNGLRELFIDALNSTNFLGVTGPISFNENGDRFGITKIEQLREIGNELVETTLGLYYPTDELGWLNESNKFEFKGGVIPLDAARVMFEQQRISTSVYIIFSSMSSLGVVLVCLFLAFNIKNRKRKLIKLSSPSINNIIAVGCALSYLSALLLGLDRILESPDAFVNICRARMWTLCIGFTLAFGGLFTKTWRVYFVFTNATKRRRVIKDSHLFLCLFVLLVIDIVILASWMVLDPPQRTTRNFTATVIALRINPIDSRVVITTMIGGNNGVKKVSPEGSDLNNKLKEKEALIETLKSTLEDKDEEIADLQAQLQKAKSMWQEQSMSSSIVTVGKSSPEPRENGECEQQL